MEGYPKKVLCINVGTKYMPGVPRLVLYKEYTAIDIEKHPLWEGAFGYILLEMGNRWKYHTRLFVDLTPTEEELELMKETELQIA